MQSTGQLPMNDGGAVQSGTRSGWRRWLVAVFLTFSLHAAALAETAGSADAAGASSADPEQVQPAASADEPAEDTTQDPASDEAAAGSAETDDEGETDEEGSFEERLDKLLAEGETAEVYGETEQCLYHRKYRHIDIINPNMLLFSRGNQYWLNTLKRECLGLRRSMVINVLMRGVGSVCANDQVYANTRFDMNQGWTPSGRPVMVRATCTLGEFRSIDETFARALLALKE